MTVGDFLVIGQRGTGLSEPFLNCASSDCSDFAAVADLPSYNTAENADDVDDLREMLGYATLDLYGISYGSRLGLEVIRRHGDRLRLARLDTNMGNLMFRQDRFEEALETAASGHAAKVIVFPGPVPDPD